MYGRSSTTLLDGRPISYRELAATQPWISIAVNGLARQISRLPLKVYKRPDPDKGAQRDRQSAFAAALKRPGRNRTRGNLKYAIACGLLIDGNHLEEFHWTGSTAGIRKLDWKWMIPYAIDGEVVTWEYRPPQGEVRLIDKDDLIHYAWEAEEGIGRSPLNALGITVRSEVASQTWAESNFKNGTRMGVAIIMAQAAQVEPGKRDALREEIEARYTGPENAGRPLILGGGVDDVKDIGAQTPVEAALIDQRKLNREEVLGVYNWPPPIAGDLEHGTYSNVAELAKIIFRIVLPPWTGLIEETTTLQLINPTDPDEHYAEFDYNSVLQGDPVQRMQAYRTAVGSGILTLNDARKLENLPPFDDIPEADVPLVMANNVKPLTQVVAETAAAATGDDKPADPDPPDPED